MDGVKADTDGHSRASGAVQSVDRALDLLETLARSDRAMGVGELAAATGLPQGTAHRLLRSLQGRGYIRHDLSRKYSLGPAAFRLRDGAQRSLAQIAAPYLRAMVEYAGETANLSVLEGDDVVYIAQVPSPHTLRMFAEVGRHVPPHTTASGKVLLSGLPADRVAALLRRTGLPGTTPNSITDVETLFGELEQTRERGWGVDEEEQELGVRCVAVPIGRGSDVIAALSLSGPAERFAGAAQTGVVEEMARLAAGFADEVLGAEASSPDGAGPDGAGADVSGDGVTR